MNELEQRWRDLGEFIREQRHLGEMSLRKLSERAGISNPYLSQIERGLRRPSAEILQQIAKALQISAETLYVRAGILDADTEAPQLLDLIRNDPDLTEDQKKTLVTVYESFRATNAATIDALLGSLDGAPSDAGAALVTDPTTDGTDADLVAGAEPDLTSDTPEAAKAETGAAESRTAAKAKASKSTPRKKASSKKATPNKAPAGKASARKVASDR